MTVCVHLIEGIARRGLGTYAMGFVYGLQPDSLFVVLPALALPSALATLAYVVTFVVGTVCAMAGYTFAIGSSWPPIDVFDHRHGCRDSIGCGNATSTVAHATSLYPCCIRCPWHWIAHSSPQPRMSITFLAVAIGEHLVNRTRTVDRHSRPLDRFQTPNWTPYLGPLLTWRRI